DGVGDRSHGHFGDVAEAHNLASWCVNGQLADSLHAGARLRSAPDDRVVRLAVPEDVTYFLASDERRRCSPDVARFQSVLRRLGQVNLDLDLGLIERDVDVIVDDASDSGELVLTLEDLSPQDGQVLPV